MALQILSPFYLAIVEIIEIKIWDRKTESQIFDTVHGRFFCQLHLLPTYSLCSQGDNFEKFWSLSWTIFQNKLYFIH